MLPYPLTKPHSSLSFGVVNRLLTDRNMPEEVPDLFQFQHCERVLDIARIARMHSFPIHQLYPAFSAGTNCVLSDHSLSCLETVKSIATITICATDVQFLL